MKTEKEVNGQQDKIQISKGDLRAGDPQIHGDLSLLVLLGLAPKCLFSQGQSHKLWTSLKILNFMLCYPNTVVTAHKSAICMRE